MEKKYRGLTITVTPEGDMFKVTVTKLDGTLVDHDDNPDYCESEEDAIFHGEYVIDEFFEAR